MTKSMPPWRDLLSYSIVLACSLVLWQLWDPGALLPAGIACVVCWVAGWHARSGYQRWRRPRA